MADTLPKGYEPHDVEARWRDHWQDNRTFTPDPDAQGEPFSIVIPPPNVTGALHIGHALNQTLIDVLCRHARQKGKNVLWVPGTDHAGIATQNVVERALAKEGKTRQDLGREAFIERVWQWREDYGHRILNQIRALGASVDWTRLRFTMDEGLSAAVRKVFVQLYNEGLIYKGDYIINWCSRCHTALADDEVEHEAHKGKLWKIRYHLADGSGSITIATTRPETIPGDTAICVHPEDERYQHLVGKTAIVPVLGREIPIIADSYVDREFGTGALKVTPCHDHNDWALGKKHDLEFLQVIDEGRLPHEDRGRHRSRRRPAGRGRPGQLRGPLLPLPHRGGTACVHAVVRGHHQDGSRRPQGRARTDPHPAGILGQDLLSLAGQHPRLVHQPPDLVGPSGSAPPCGPSPPWAGPSRPRIWPPGTPPACW